MILLLLFFLDTSSIKCNYSYWWFDKKPDNLIGDWKEKSDELIDEKPPNLIRIMGRKTDDY